MRSRFVVAALAAMLSMGTAATASAGGFYFTDRGVRSMGRGFAMVAGSDDPQALVYNPAGLAWSGKQLLFDASLTLLDAEFTRVDGGGNIQPTVDLGQARIPIPMLAYSQPLHEDWTLGFGFFAPNAILASYPAHVDSEGSPCEAGLPGCEPAPQRYSLLNLDGTALVHLAMAVAYQPIEQLSIGLGGQLMVGTFQAQVAMSACDGAICTQPENPDYDGVAEIKLTPVIEPGLQFGMTYDGGKFRLGASVLWWPTAIEGDATLKVRLPSAPLFEGATVDGDRAHVEIPFPLTLRAGFELRPLPNLRAEVAYVWERWSSHEAITIEPDDIWIRDLTAIGEYQAGDASVLRNMRNVHSLRVGGTYTPTPWLDLSMGYNYETSGFEDATLTPLTLDATKHILAFGASFEVHRGVWMDFSYAHVFMGDPLVTNSAVEQSNLLRPPLDPSNPLGPTPLGNGKYEMEANLLGFGIRWQIDRTFAAEEPVS